jgi:transcription elongation GreA/GreB family factor
MLRRDLLYTGITRTQTKLMLLSDLNTLRRAIDNNIVENRYSSLLEYLKFSNFVSIGDTVKLKDRLNDEVIEYTVVEEDEADVLNSKISFKSPIGKALLKREAGDMFELTTNGNRNVYEILSVNSN